MNAFELLFALLACHALADYPLQGDFLAQAKNRHTSVGKSIWWMALPSHGFIHGGFVWLITDNWLLGIAETVAHCAIDAAKCENKINYAIDQALHVVCKAAWIAVLYFGLLPS